MVRDEAYYVYLSLTLFIVNKGTLCLSKSGLADIMEGHEVDEEKVKQDDATHDEFNETATATTFTLQLLLSKRAVHRAMVALEVAVEGTREAYLAEPRKDFSHALEVIRAKEDKLTAEMGTTALVPAAPLMQQAAAVLKSSCLVQAKVCKKAAPEVELDVKPFMTAEADNPYKLAHLQAPQFSGKVEDWVPFWNKFQQQVETRRLSDDGKLAYLIQALGSLDIKNTVERQVLKKKSFTLIVKDLHSRYDQPRSIHKKYCKDLKYLTTHADTGVGMRAFADSLNKILDGFIRLKAEDCRQFMTTLAEPFLSPTVKAGWDLHTERRKDIPSIEELIEYLEMKADQAPQEEEVPAARSAAEGHKSKPKPSTQHSYSGSSHVTTAPPATTPSSSPSTRGKGATPRSTYPCRYTCPCVLKITTPSSVVSLRISQSLRGRSMEGTQSLQQLPEARAHSISLQVYLQMQDLQWRSQLLAA